MATVLIRLFKVAVISIFLLIIVAMALPDLLLMTVDDPYGKD